MLAVGHHLHPLNGSQRFIWVTFILVFQTSPQPLTRVLLTSHPPSSLTSEETRPLQQKLNEHLGLPKENRSTSDKKIRHATSNLSKKENKHLPRRSMYAIYAAPLTPLAPLDWQSGVEKTDKAPLEHLGPSDLSGMALSLAATLLGKDRSRLLRHHDHGGAATEATSRTRRKAHRDLAPVLCGRSPCGVRSISCTSFFSSRPFCDLFPGLRSDRNQPGDQVTVTLRNQVSGKSVLHFVASVPFLFTSLPCRAWRRA